MKSQEIQEKSGTLDWLKWLVVWLLLAASFGGNVYYGSYSVAIRASVLIFLAIVMLLIAVTTKAGAKAWVFLKEAKIELRKVVWPSRQETTQTTMIVIGIVIVMSLVLWGIDSLFAYIVSSIIF